MRGQGKGACWSHREKRSVSRQSSQHDRILHKHSLIKAHTAVYDSLQIVLFTLGSGDAVHTTLQKGIPTQKRRLAVRRSGPSHQTQSFYTPNKRKGSEILVHAPRLSFMKPWSRSICYRVSQGCGWMGRATDEVIALSLSLVSFKLMRKSSCATSGWSPRL
jgi:hypothetical protein